MKIEIPILDNIYSRISQRAVNKVLRNLNYELYYDAYKKYVIDTQYDVPTDIEFKHVENPLVSIIIAVYNHYDLTMQCLNSIKLNAGIDDYEIIIVDDCSTDETVNISDHVRNVTVIRNQENLGVLSNCNKAAKVARGQYIYLLNNDTKLLPDAIKELVDILNNDPNVGAVGSKLIYPDGRLQAVGSMLLRKAKINSVGKGENPLEERFNKLVEADYCCGASLMIRKSIWEELNGYDELFSPGYYEEIDFCVRTRLKGYKVVCQPKSEVIHITSQTFSERARIFLKKNRKKFYKKWKKHINL